MSYLLGLLYHLVSEHSARQFIVCQLRGGLTFWHSVRPPMEHMDLIHLMTDYGGEDKCR